METPSTGQHAYAHRGRWRRAGRVHLAALTATCVLFGGWLAPSASAVGSAAAACKPDSGKQLAHAHLTQAQVGTQSDLSCANLRDADLAGLHLDQITLTGADLQGATLTGASLGQATLTGANLTGALLQNVDLIQATITGANFTGANLSHARLGQAEAKGAIFTNADLSGVDLSQAELANAQLNGAKLGGSDFTQAHTSGADFSGAKGVTPWNLYLLIGAAVIFALLTLQLVRDMGRGGLTSGQKARGFGIGLLGRAVIVLGAHLLVGSILGIITSSFGQPTTQTCSGPQCAVGVGAGMYGPFIGVGAILVGFAVASRASSAPTPASLGPARVGNTIG